VTAAPPDGCFVARRRVENLAEVELDGESVLYDGLTGALHLLDPIATVVWERLDGSMTIGLLAAELAQAFQAETAIVEADIIALVRHLAAQGLLI